jgi:hypothetical protein
MECNFCKKTFSTISSLTVHQKTTKYCLTIQGKTNEQYKCTFCDKCFTTHQQLDKHDKICKIKQDTNYEQELKKIKDEFLLYKKQDKTRLKYCENTIKEKNEYIAKLEAKLEKFENAVTNMAAATTLVMEAKAAKDAAPTTTNNTTNITVTNNNTLNLSKEHVKKVLSEHLNYNVVYAGQAGLATFVVDNMLKDETGRLMYRCVDPSRQMFEFIDENGETVRDMRAEKLIQSLLKGDAIKLGLEAAAVGWNTEDRSLNNERAAVFGTKVNEYADLNRNNTVFRTKVSSLTT